MNFATGRAVIVAILAIACCHVYGQVEGEDNPRGNVNLGFNLAAPLNPMGRFANFAEGINVGAGYNFNRQNAVVIEFMWNNLNPDSGALNSIRTALQNPSIKAKSDVSSFTANYRLEFRGQKLGTYFIGGGGLYHRGSSLSQTIATGSNIACSPTWLWWGFSCSSGTVTANQTIASSSSNTLGANAGVGFTFRVGEAPYRIYLESRYHYAPTRAINTQLVTVTVGIRY